MRRFSALFLFGLVLGTPFLVAQDQGSSSGDEFAVLLERLRRESPGEHAKVVQLAKTDRAAALQFLRQRFGTKGQKPTPEKKPDKDASKPVRGRTNLPRPLCRRAMNGTP